MNLPSLFLFLLQYIDQFDGADEANEMAPSFLESFVSHFPPSLELFWRQHPVPRMLALRIIEHLDVIEQIKPSFVTGSIGSPPDPFTIERVEKALCDGIFVEVPPAAHRKRCASPPVRRCLTAD